MTANTRPETAKADCRGARCSSAPACIVLAKHGLDPVKDVEWRQYPAEVLPLALDKGEVQALADNDPRTYLWLKEGKLMEIATNLTGECASRTCCVLAARLADP